MFRWKGENVATTEVAAVIGMLDFIQEANVYGVAVPGTNIFQVFGGFPEENVLLFFSFVTTSAFHIVHIPINTLVLAWQVTS